MTDVVTTTVDATAAPKPASKRWIPGSTKFRGARGRTYDKRTSFGRRRSGLIKSITRATLGNAKPDAIVAAQITRIADLEMLAEAARTATFASAATDADRERAMGIEKQLRQAWKHLSELARSLAPIA
jgi:hypothetical protein